MIFSRKTMEELQAEQQKISEQISQQKQKVAEVRQLRAMEQEIAEQKQSLKQLKNEAKDNLYRRIRSHTSPVLQGINRKVREKLPIIGRGIMKVSEMGAKVQMGMAKQSKKKARLW